jgi:hypothetical protein
MKTSSHSPVFLRQGFKAWEVAFLLILVGVVVAAIIPTIRRSTHRDIVPAASGGLSKIATSYISMASVERPRRINVATIHDYALAIARYGDLNNPEPWLIKSDPRVEKQFNSTNKFPVLVTEKSASAGGDWKVTSEFAAYKISLAVANNTPLDAKDTTPILWTRGLKTDGTWDEKNSVFGKSHGIIMFRNGTVRTYSSEELSEGAGALINYKTGKPTKNILEAIHPEANVLESK